MTGLRRARTAARAASRVRDRESGEQFDVRAANVVNATGVWADRLRPRRAARRGRGAAASGPAAARTSRSRREDLPLVGGAIVPAGGGRTIFALPWLGRTLIGTTDNDYEASDLEHIAPAGEDIDYLLERDQRVLRAPSSADADLTGAFAGVRPLISTGDPKKSVDISRKAELYETSSGMITITGGKLTTWRRMAKMTVDRLVEREARDAPCRTARDPARAGDRPSSELPRVEGVPERAYERARRPLRLRRARRARRSPPSAASWRSRSSTGLPDLLAEVAFAARREQARAIGDVLLRRTRLGLLAAREVAAGDVLERVAGALAARARLGRRARRSTEVERFRAEAVAEGIAP